MVLNILKEDLEKYYVDEKKSMLEISRIYECNDVTIRNKLKKYNIPIRPHGSFLLADDGKTLYSKYIKGEISDSEYLNEMVKEKGYKNWNDYQSKKVKEKGFENFNDYVNKMNHKNGKYLPMNENKNCPKYLGVHICENKEFLSKIINIIENMPENNPGYDVVCGKGKKIDVKCSCLVRNNEWMFNINKNKIADYFLMISFNDRENLNVQHIWLVKGDSVIEKTNVYQSKEFIFNERDAITISKGNKSLKRWITHEITDTYKLKEVQKVCDEFKEMV